MRDETESLSSGNDSSGSHSSGQVGGYAEGHPDGPPVELEVDIGAEPKGGSLLDVFRHHEKSLRNYISGFFITPQDIDDISQETFLRTYTSHLQGEIHKPKPFMFRVAKNLIISEFRRSSYKLTDYIDDMPTDEEPLSISNPENDLQSQQTLGLLCEALVTLPEKCRRVMVMRKVYGLSIKEISLRLDMPTSTINWNLAKGMAHLDDLVEQQEQGDIKRAPASSTLTPRQGG